MALLTLDIRRVEARRCDFVPCLVIRRPDGQAAEGDGGNAAGPRPGPANERSVSAFLHRFVTQACPKQFDRGLIVRTWALTGRGFEEMNDRVYAS